MPPGQSPGRPRPVGWTPSGSPRRASLARLYHPDIPDVDLFLRTSGEERTSNFLLWQAAYAELVFAPELWPDVDRRVLWRAGRPVRRARAPDGQGLSVLVITRHRVPSAQGSDFLARAREAVAALAPAPGFLGATVGRATDDAELWVVQTTWRDVGSYRRAVSTTDARIRAVPLAVHRAGRAVGLRGPARPRCGPWPGVCRAPARTPGPRWPRTPAPPASARQPLRSSAPTSTPDGVPDS